MDFATITGSLPGPTKGLDVSTLSKNSGILFHVIGDVAKRAVALQTLSVSTVRLRE